jgi:hypothetical protein
MSDDDWREPWMKKWRRRRLLLALAVLVVLTLYEIAHMATDARAFEIETDRTGKAICVLHGGHTIRGKAVPGWAERSFCVAELIDDLIGRSPPDKAQQPKLDVIY